MDLPFPAYTGDQPYVFVCYAHADKEFVYPELAWLKAQGCNIWYDQGISPGASWRNELADSISGSRLFLYFITPQSIESRNCQKEVNFAIEHEKPFIAVHATQTTLSPGMELSLSDIQAILKYELSEEQYRDKLLSGVSSHLGQVQAPAPATTESPAKPIVTGSRPGIFAELKRRQVFRVGIGYVVIAWILLQIADIFFPALNLPYWTVRFVAGLLVLGFPVSLFLAWAYEMTPEGIKPSHTQSLGVQVTPSEPSNINKPLKRSRRSIVAFVLIGLIVTGATLFVFERTRTWIVQAGTETALDLTMYAATIFPHKFEKEVAIAVLPFTNMSSDVDNIYFSDGISEEILNALVRTNHLPVIARTSSFQFRDTDVKEVGRVLGVTHVLEGSVRKVGDQVRITAQLIDTDTGRPLWSESYDRALLDVFAIQDEIARSLVERIELELGREASPADMATIPRTGNLAAYDLYLQAQQYVTSGNPRDLPKAYDLYQEAVSLDEDYLDALKGSIDMALKETLGQFETFAIPAAHLDIAEEACSKVLEREPNNARAMALLGGVLFMRDWNWEEGLALIKRATELRPEDPLLFTLKGIYQQRGVDEDVFPSAIRKAYRLDPLNPSIAMGMAYQLLRDNPFEAMQIAQKLAVHNADSFQTNIFLALFYRAIAFNTMKPRVDYEPPNFDLVEFYLARAKEIVGSDYAAIRIVEMQMLYSERDIEGVIKISDDLWQRSASEYIKPLYALNLILPTDLDTRTYGIIDIWDRMYEQRNPMLLMVGLMNNSKPITYPASKWKDLLVKTNTSNFSDKHKSWMNSFKQTYDEMASKRVSLDSEQLRLYAGRYKQVTNNGLRDGSRLGKNAPFFRWRLNLSPEGDQLAGFNAWRDPIRLVPIGVHRFADLDYLIEYQFKVVNDKVVALTEEVSPVTRRIPSGPMSWSGWYYEDYPNVHWLKIE